MRELVNTARTVGLKKLIDLSRAQRRFWKDTISGYFATHVIQTLFSVGFFDTVRTSNRLRISEFAASHDLDPETLRILCDYLLCIGLLKKEDSHYSLTKDGCLLVDLAKGWFEAISGYEDVYYHLEDILRKRKTYGKDFFRNPHLNARGSGKMESLIYYPLVIQKIAENGYSKVLDLGCGDGEFLLNLTNTNPNATGYGIDNEPQSITHAKERASQAGLKDRIHFLCNDLAKLKQSPDHLLDVEVATAFFVLHEILYQGPKVLIEFLKSCRRLFSKIPLIVVEVNRASIEEIRKSSGMSAEYYLQHDLSHQKLVSSGQWIELFRSAGFDSIVQRQLKFAKSSIFTLC